MHLIRKTFNANDLIEDFFDKQNNNEMKCDVYEKEGVYHIEMDLPGFDKEKVKLSQDDGYLLISAEKESRNEEENKYYIRQERSFGKYERSFYIGDLDTDNIEAKFENNVLMISVPKKAIENTRKEIEIKKVD